MANLTDDALFALLRSEMFGTDVPRELMGGAEWDEVFTLAKKQTVVGLVGEAVGKLPEDLKPSQAIMHKFMNACLAIAQANAKLDTALARLVHTYRQRGIEGVLLKGQGIARCYPQTHMRQCGDIDFYVGVGQYDRSVDIARELAPESNGAHESYKHYEFPAYGVMIELHRHAAIPLRPWMGRRLERWISGMLDDKQKLRKIEIAGESVFLPPVLFDIVYVFHHAAFHLVGFEGIGLRQLCDWAMVLHVHREEFDREELAEILRYLSLTGLWRVFGYIAVNYLGLPSNEMPLYKDSSRVRRRALRALDIIMKGGNFGHEAMRGTGYNPKDPTLRGRWRRMSWQVGCSMQVLPVAPVEVGSSLINYLVTGPFRVFKRRLH